MCRRCSWPSHASYQYYGGRGISVCERWKASFWAFAEDMGECPPGFTLERLDTNGNYEPGNCTWATYTAQANNRRNNVVVTVDGVAMTIAQACRQTGVKYATAMGRLRRGWSHERAVSL